jgi:hypothetical protein
MRAAKQSAICETQRSAAIDQKVSHIDDIVYVTVSLQAPSQSAFWLWHASPE